MFEEPRQNYGRGFVDRKLVEPSPPPPPSNFIAGRLKAALLFCLFLFVLFAFFLARFIVVASSVSVYFVCDFSIVATCPSIPAAHFAFCLCFIRFVFVVHSCFSGEPSRTKGEGWSTAPSNFIAGRPKAALLFMVLW